jgi:hypothetical protein
MPYAQLVSLIADLLFQLDASKPVHKKFQPGIGPFGEPQLIKILAERLTDLGFSATTQRTPDLRIDADCAIEFKIVRPYGDNGNEAEDWSVNVLHPYPGNVSLIGDAIKLGELQGYSMKGLFVIGFEHSPAKISLDPLLDSFEAICRAVMSIRLEERIEEKRGPLVHPEHQILRCVGWQLAPP